MKFKHLTADELTGYIYATLEDAQREVMDTHLAECPLCRTSLAERELLQRQISNEVEAALKLATPSPHMTFAAIAPRLQTRPVPQRIWLDRAIVLPATLALTGFVLALFGVGQAIGTRAFTSPGQPLGVVPPLACFFLALASVEQLDSSLALFPRRAVLWVVTAVLWLGSAFICLLDLVALRDLAILAVTALGGQIAAAEPVAMLTVLFGAILYIGFIIGGAEYHYKNIGLPGSWKLFTVTLLVQLFILMLPYLIT